MSIYPKLEHIAMQSSSEGMCEFDTAADDSSHRLKHIREIKRRLENEQEKWAGLYKKYRRTVNIIDGADTTLLVLCTGLGIGGVSLLSTIIAAPVVIGLEIAALSCGILSGGGKFIAFRLALKAKKHDEIRVLADSKLNTIADYVSTALIDGEISDQEFKLVLAEMSKYQQMKKEIRGGIQKAHDAVAIDEETKNCLIMQGREEARASLIKKLTISDSPST